MDSSFSDKALCYVEQTFARRHNAFFSSADNAVRQGFAAMPLDFEHDVFVFDTITSTLDVCHDLSGQGAVEDFSSVVCREQSSGRGQLRRTWQSLRNNLYTALVLPDAYPFNTEAAAPAVGFLFACALENLGFRTELKWPNDLVQKRNGVYEKIGGILLEERNGRLVAGTGINLSSCPDDTQLRENFFISAGILDGFTAKENQKKFLDIFYNSLKSGLAKKNFDILQHIENKDEFINFCVILGFWFALVKEIKLCYKTKILSCNTHTWNAMYKKYLAFLGDTVLVKDALAKQEFSSEEIFGGDLEGQIIGLGQEGELLLSSRSGLMCIVGGSVTKFKG